MEKRTILLVEDTPELAGFVIAALELLGYAPVHRDTGEAAVAYLQEARPDLILLDLNLPGMSGWQVLEAAVQRWGKDAVPVVVMTAYSDSANRVIGKLQDVRDYLVKPFEVETLRQSIEQALSGTSAEAAD